jgi:hypothetical protein
MNSPLPRVVYPDIGQRKEIVRNLAKHSAVIAAYEPSLHKPETLTPFQAIP